MFWMLGRALRPRDQAGGPAAPGEHRDAAPEPQVAPVRLGHPSGGTAQPLVVDVRPLVAAGQEPFGAIMVAVAQLRGNQPLVVKAPFEPVPLFGVLAAQGFEYRAEPLAGGDWQVRFTRPIAAR